MLSLEGKKFDILCIKVVHILVCKNEKHAEKIIFKKNCRN